MLSLLRLFGNREVDDWRDRHIKIAAKTLNEVACDLIEGFGPALEAAGWRDGLLTPTNFIARSVAPTVAEVGQATARMVIERANTELAELVEHRAVWARQISPEPIDADAAQGVFDVAAAAGPLGGGAATLIALPGLAATTTAGFLGTGLFATTVISWPVVVVGGVVGIAGIATGVLNAGRVTGNARERLRRKVSDHVIACLLRGPPRHPALLYQLKALLAETARQAKALQ